MRILPSAVAVIIQKSKIERRRPIIETSSIGLGELDKSFADYNDALRLNPKLISSLYGRGIAKMRKGDPSSANADIAAAKALRPSIAEEFAVYGIR